MPDAPLPSAPCPFCGVAADHEGLILHSEECWMTLYYGQGERGPYVEVAWNRRATVATVRLPALKPIPAGASFNDPAHHWNDALERSAIMLHEQGIQVQR